MICLALAAVAAHSVDWVTSLSNGSASTLPRNLPNSSAVRRLEALFAIGWRADLASTAF